MMPPRSRDSEPLRDVGEMSAADPVVRAVSVFMSGRVSWTGRASDLLAALAPHASIGARTDASWPTTAQQLSVRLARSAVALQAEGIVVERRRTSRARRLTLRRSSAEQGNDRAPEPVGAPGTGATAEAAQVREVLENPFVREVLAVFEPELVEVQLTNGARWIARRVGAADEASTIGHPEAAPAPAGIRSATHEDATTIETAASRLATTPEALRARCRRAARTHDGETLAELGGGVVAFKLGRTWRVRLGGPT